MLLVPPYVVGRWDRLVRPRRDDLPIYLPMRGGKYIRLIPGPRGYEREQSMPCPKEMLEFDFASIETSILDSYVQARRKS
jgi:hypothetical protein